MDRVRIKICGLMRPQDIDMVNEVCPDIAGFILASGRRRTVTPEQMRELTGRLKPEIRSAAVFLDQDIRWIADLAEGGLMDIIQLHGHEGNEEIRYLRSRTDKTVIKAFRIDTAENIRRAEDSEADLVLLDHGAGGTGQAWDWSLLTGMKRPFILAGGLDSENVQEAVSKTHPFGVDVSSGVETDGCKDREKILRFVRTVRGCCVVGSKYADGVLER